MARKRTKEKEETAIQITFEGGPRDGTAMRVGNPPPPRLRLAFPEWCNYYRVGNTSSYKFDNEIPWVSVNALKEITKQSKAKAKARKNG